jgi:hypothetical protein
MGDFAPLLTKQCGEQERPRQSRLRPARECAGFWAFSSKSGPISYWHNPNELSSRQLVIVGPYPGMHAEALQSLLVAGYATPNVFVWRILANTYKKLLEAMNTIESFC